MASAVTSTKKQDQLLKDIKPETLAHEFSKKLGIKPYEFKRYTGTHIADQAKYVQIRFDDKFVRKHGTLEIVHLTDVQFGHVFCKEERVEEFVDWVLAAENRFVVLGGDLIDAAHIHSPGGPMDNKWKPDSQLLKFCMLFSRVAHRVLGSVSGNHEQRQVLYFGDLGRMLAILMGWPYSSGQQYVDVHWGEHKPFRIELWHGRGAARSKGAKLNMIAEHMNQNPDANLILVGHLHEPIMTFNWVKKPDPANMKVRLVKQGGTMSSSFLEFWGNYGEVKGLSVTDVMMARVILEPDGKWELTFR
jgi:hypothetical protein